MSRTRRDMIQVTELAGAPPCSRYRATYGDWDLGDPQGTGATPKQAIEDLEWDAGEDRAAK